ncbi:hypothetical protein BOX15_Mlig007446g1, partial [Macrostomum lignano]
RTLRLKVKTGCVWHPNRNINVGPRINFTGLFCLSMDEQSEQQTLTLLEKCGALLIGQCQQLQQILQQQQLQQPSEAASAAATGDTLSRKLSSALLVLQLHSNYSGRLFDLLRSELRSALSFKVDNSPDLISVKYRETTKLLKDLCLRSKAMSHDVIKGSRELVKAFKAIQRSDERRRSSSALSRVRDLAMAPIRCRSSSRSSRQTTTASSETGATGKSAKPAAQQPSMTGKSFALLSLERSPRNRSPKQTTPAAVSEFKSPVPPRRSSSLNSVPPELHRLLQRHQKLQEPPQCQPSGLRCTENCVKILSKTERHRIVEPSVTLQQQYHAQYRSQREHQQHQQEYQYQHRQDYQQHQYQHEQRQYRSESSNTPASPKASVSSEGTAQLPSEASCSPNSVGDAKSFVDKGNKEEYSGVKKMSDIATKVFKVDSAQTGLFRSTSANMSELDCTGSAAVRDQITMKSSPKQEEVADSAAIVEPTGSVQKLRKLQTLPVEAEEAQSRPVQAVVKRRRHRRPRRAHPTFGGGTSRKSATMTVASRRGNFSEESTRYGHRSGLFSDTSSSGSSGGASGDDESSRAQPAKPKQQQQQQQQQQHTLPQKQQQQEQQEICGTRFLASGVLETDV